MAEYNNQYSNSMKITPATPNLRGLTTNYSNDGQNNLGGIGLGDLYNLDYDRNKIEGIFNQGTDAEYALMQKENRIAENQYANNQFANQQSAIETLRQQRNNQIASGMARGLNAAQEQGTVLGVQQDASAQALELANQRQLEADKIASEYANNVSKALQEANSVKQAMAQVGAQLYEADMLGYTGELNAAAQMDANASDRYGYELGLEGTRYTADKGLEGTKYNADRNYEGTVYSADRNLEGTKYNADRNLEGSKYTADRNYAAQIGAANISASAQRAAASIAAASGSSQKEVLSATDKAINEAVKNVKSNDPNAIVNYATQYLLGNASTSDKVANMEYGKVFDLVDDLVVSKGYKNQTYQNWLNNK